MNKQTVGRCSQCGGAVTLPLLWGGVNPPVATCDDCGATEDRLAHLPTIPMKPVGGERPRIGPWPTRYG